MEERKAEDLDDWQKRSLAYLQQIRFVEKRFASYPCLQPRDPEKQSFWVPYTGQEYDPEIFEGIEKGWDHEHCWICNASIEEGNPYWASCDPEGYELCPACYDRYMARYSQPPMD